MEETGPPAKIRVENVFKIFGRDPGRGIKMLDEGLGKDAIMEKTRLAVGVDDASFEVAEGELLVVMGLSGSGKSTLLRCINRLIEPTAGKVVIDGVDVTALNAEELRRLRMKKFGMVFQRFALLPHRTVLQNTEFGLEIQGVEPATRTQKARDALKLVGLSGWEDSAPDELSGGMQQRVGLARALAVDPDILLMDEAFSALDPLIRREMQDELLSLQSRMRKTILFITHDLDEALKLGDRIIIMKDGRIVQIGTPEDILTNPATEYVERFVEDVNLAKVLTARSVMHKASCVTLGKDGPKTALRKMKEIGISGLLVVDRERRLVGRVTADDASRLAAEGSKDLEAILLRDVPQVLPEAALSEIFAIESFPVAVTDEDGRLQGLIIRGALLAAMAERSDD
ncbi:glycine betaine/proline transport system ATP-binding protein [Geoalkalibacter ferrihydriticus]|uniref:Glycine/betaine ABC transporter ATP-binding protein n=2 Tax=Geoalkalibacter ferrihydriticus TaxID=392333 RepID=A0A0C2EGD5_9BACT|nr:glycine betaine/L-proline ABC transporter ATP-binding protein [Geoalkalibacter ferrihydriticus]KIH77673.1 glycine/betaine ABC transporter ATP-binding protein [Geoalkalibacter ferrihydriticus DSM 17813]SDL73146.1 glycine betaine/proline transport system ATP-binding protein [Geoalkalibacter ferrihydriticus]